MKTRRLTTLLKARLPDGQPLNVQWKARGFIAAVFVTFFSAVAQAESTVSIESLVNTCTACHGANGISSNSLWPNLAGQKSVYLATELKAFRDGRRQDPLMAASAKNLSDAQIDALALYYSKLPATMTAAANVNQAGRNVRAYCISCHGIKGLTVNDLWPNLAGQQKAYLQKQLQAFRDDTRIGPSMQVIAKELNEEQIEAVAEYYSNYLSASPISPATL